MTGIFPVFTALNAGITAPEPETGRPILVLELVQE
jgi:hypothetical protein